MLAGSDGLFIGVCLLVTSQFRVVQHQLELLEHEECSKPEHSDEHASDSNRVLHQLKLIADRHGQAIEIAHEMSLLFVPNVFTCYTIAAIKLGLTCLIILEVIFKTVDFRLTLTKRIFSGTNLCEVHLHIWIIRNRDRDFRLLVRRIKIDGRGHLFQMF